MPGDFWREKMDQTASCPAVLIGSGSSCANGIRVKHLQMRSRSPEYGIKASGYHGCVWAVSRLTPGM